MGKEQSTFADMVSELGLTAEMKSEADYTFLAPLNIAFSGETCTVLLYYQQVVKYNKKQATDPQSIHCRY